MGSMAENRAEQLPDASLCPITRSVMQDPYLLVDSGHSYEGAAIRKWLEKHPRDPCTNTEVAREAKLVPNHTLRRVLGELQDYARMQHWVRTKEAERVEEEILRGELNAERTKRRGRKGRDYSVPSLVYIVVGQACTMTAFFLHDAVQTLAEENFSRRAMVALLLAANLLVTLFVVWLVRILVLLSQIFFDYLASKDRECADRPWGREGKSRRGECPRRLRCLKTIKMESGGGVRSLGVKGTRLISMDSKFNVKVWDLRTGACLQDLKGSSEEVWAMATRTTKIFFGRYRQRVHLLENERLMSGEEEELGRSPLRTPQPLEACMLPVVCGGGFFFVATVDCKVAVHLRYEAFNRRTQELQGHGGWVRNILFARCRNRLQSLQSGTGGEEVRWISDDWDEEGGGGGGGGGGGVSLLFTGSNDATVRVWYHEEEEEEVKSVTSDLWQTMREESGRSIVLRGHRGAVLGLAVTGRRLLSSSCDGSIRVWGMTGGWDCVQVLEGHRGGVYDVMVHEGIVLSGSEEREIKVWGWV